VRLKVVAVAAGALVALLPASPALAHDQVPAASDYRTELVAVTPQPPGLDVRVVQNGARIELHNRTGHDVTVLGYQGEPYLRITPDATFVNTRSPALYVNEKRTAPKDAGPKATPSWRRISDEPVTRWHDHRSHWTGTALPPAAAAEPGSPHRIADWTVDVIADRTPVKVTGTLDYAPPPAAPVWWAGMLALAGAIVLLGQWRHGVPALGVVLGVAAAAEIADSVGRVLDSGAAGLGVVGALLTTETYGTITALAAVAAAVLAMRRRPAAPFALALAAACLGVLGGVTDIAVFGQAFAPAPWPGSVARALTAATIALCAGVALAGWLRVRADRNPPAHPTPDVSLARA